MCNLTKIKNITNQFSKTQAPFLHDMLTEWQDTQPLRGVRLVHNLINSKETLFKLLCLIASGADLTITALKIPGLQSYLNVDDALKSSAITFIPEHRDLTGHFDIALDCAAQLMPLKNISLGAAVELTGIGTKYHEQYPPIIPVIDVNNSAIKNFECLHGTGEAFIRAMEKLTSEVLHDKTFILFGYGKVGQGIYTHLQQRGNTIIVFEKNPDIIADLQKQHILAYPISEISSQTSLLKSAFCIVTAIGIKNSLSNLGLTPGHFGNAYLAVMSGPDDFGVNFSERDVLFNKLPVNFCLDEPTLMRYLDPVFYAHNLAAKILLAGVTPGYHAFPKEIDLAVLERWHSLHNEKA